MKFKHIGLLGASLPLLLSCTPSNIAGTYTFQLGKETGTHFGIYLTLTNEQYGTPEENLKQFDLAASISSSQEGSFIPADLEEALEVIKKEDGRYHIPGYYQVTGEVTPKGETRLIMGLDIDVIIDYVKQIYKALMEKDLDIPQETIDLIKNSKVIDKIVYSSYKDDYVYCYVPVSFADIYYQLYWYGYDLQIKLLPDPEPEPDPNQDPNPLRVSLKEGEESTDTGEGEGEGEGDNPFPISIEVVELPDEKKHSFGQNPTKEDIDKINETFAAEHEGMVIIDTTSRTFVEPLTSYRAFNVIQMGLIKQ